MGITWFAVDCNAYTNPKILKLSTLLKLDVDTTVGKLGRLWAWAGLSGNETGEMPYMTPQEIADIMRWRKKANILFDALIECGLLDKNNDVLFIHDWNELNGSFYEKKRKDNERKKRGNSTEILRKFQDDSAPTVPNHTIPSIDNDDDSARESVFGIAMAYYMDKICSTPSTAMIPDMQRYAETMSADVITDAIDKALDAGTPNWNYINKILSNREKAGVKTMADVERERQKRERSKADGKGGGYKRSDNADDDGDDGIDWGKLTPKL